MTRRYRTTPNAEAKRISNLVPQVKVLRCIPPIAREDTLLGQYVAANGKPGYLDDDTVPHNSVCLWVNNPRWEGVPFILKAGVEGELT